MDEKGMVTKKYRRLATGYGAGMGALQGAANNYISTRGLPNKTRGISTAVGAGVGALAGGLGANVGVRLSNKLRKGMAEGNKKYLNPRIKGVDDEADKKDRRKRIARNIAIGAGATAAAAGLGYLAYKNRQKLLSRRLKGSEQQRLTGNLALPGITKGSSGDGWSKLGRAKMANGKRVSSAVAPGIGSGKKFKFTSRSTGTSIVPANTNRQLGFLKEEPRRLNWKRVAAYRRRKSRKRRR